MAAVVRPLRSQKLTKVFRPSASFYSISAQIPLFAVSKLAAQIPRCFRLKRETQGEHSVQRGPPAPPPEQLQPMTSVYILIDRSHGYSSRRRGSIPPNHGRTNGKRRAWGCFRVFCESGAVESWLKTGESERVPRVTHSLGGSGVPKDNGEIQTFPYGYLPYK